MNRKVWIGAALMALATPLAAAAGELANGEIALHIETTGVVEADAAMLNLRLSAEGPSRGEAERALQAKEQALYRRLAAQGITPDKLTPGALESVTDQIDVAISAAAAAADAAAESSESGQAANTLRPPKPEPRFVVRRPVAVVVDDLTRVAAIQQLAREEEDYYTARPQYFVRDAARARQAALAQALTNARAEAEAHAAALGYRIVRMERVSNAKPALNWPDLVTMIGGIEGRTGSGPDRERRLMSSTYAGIAIDYVLAPK